MANPLEIYQSFKNGPPPSEPDPIALEIADAYATSGEQVPEQVRAQLGQLDELQARAFSYRGLSPNARASLTGTGYKAGEIENQIRTLKTQLYETSAPARTAKARADVGILNQRLRSMELKNTAVAGTLDSAISVDNAQNRLAAAQADKDTRAIEHEQKVLAATVDAQNAQMDTGMVADLLENGTPEDLTRAFGTTDRSVLQDMYTELNGAQNSKAVAEANQMATAALIKGTELAADPAISSSQIQQMLSGQLEVPEGLSTLALSEALKVRVAQQEGVAQYMVQKTEGFATQRQMYSALLGAQTPSNMEQLLLSAGGFGADQMQMASAALRGQLGAEQAGAVREQIQASADNGMIQLLDPNGEQVELPVQAVLQEFDRALVTSQDNATQQIVANSRFRQFQLQTRDLSRQLETAGAWLGGSVPESLRAGIEIAIEEAQALNLAAAKAPTVAERKDLAEAANTVMRNAREIIIETAKERGVAAPILEDIRQGRISSQQSFKMHISGALGYGQAGLGNTQLSKKLSNYVSRLGIAPQAWAAWAADPDAELEDLHPELASDKLRNLVYDDAVGVLVTGTLGILQTMPSYQLLPQTARDQLDLVVQNVFNPATREEILAPDVALKKVLSTVRIMDEQATLANIELAKTDPEAANQYVPGQLQKELAIRLTEADVLNNYYRNGKQSITPALAALLTEATAGTSGATKFGEGATPLEDVLGAATTTITEDMRYAVFGNAQSDISAVRSSVSRTAMRFLTEASPRGYATTTELTNSENRLPVERALWGIYQRKLVSPEKYRTTLFGMQLPSWGENFGSGVPNTGTFDTIASNDEIRAELEKMGYTELAQRFNR